MRIKIPISKHASKLRTLNPNPASTILFEGDSFTNLIPLCSGLIALLFLFRNRLKFI